MFVVLYALSLFVPFVSNGTKYPFYFVKCGGRPIVAMEFAAAMSYRIPSDKAYEMIGDRYFCTEQEAIDAGFHRYLSY